MLLTYIHPSIMSHDYITKFMTHYHTVIHTKL